MPETYKLLSGSIPFLIACYILFKLLRFGHREKHLPPGPSTVPILGNAHLLPSTGLYIKLILHFLLLAISTNLPNQVQRME
jgi:hypothetical protein